MVIHNITELVGNTPIVKLRKVIHDCKSDVFVKLESFNPSGSVKDRAALNMINVAEKEGKINKDTLIIEATSGNTGIALATIAAAKGYKLLLYIPDTMSPDKMSMIKALGAEIITTPGVFGMKKSFIEAEKKYSETENAFMPHQITNPNNPGAHVTTTAKEIWNDMNGDLDYFVAASGTGGTICGTARGLKNYSEKIKIICVEPAGSPVISGGKRGPHKIQGVGPGFIPETTDIKLFDEIITVRDEDAMNMARQLARTEGLLVGISSGAAVWAALEVAKKVENKKIVVISADGGERYLHTELFDKSYEGVVVS